MCRALLRFPHLSFIPPVPYPPLRGTFPSRGRLCRGYCFSTHACIRSDDMGIALLSQTAYLRRSPTLFHAASTLSAPSWHLPLEEKALCLGQRHSRKWRTRDDLPLSFIPLVPYSPLRGTFPSKGRLYVGDSDALVYDALETIFSLSFIPLVPYPARFARHLPHAGKALCRGQRHSHKCRASILCKQKPLCED